MKEANRQNATAAGQLRFWKFYAPLITIALMCGALLSAQEANRIKRNYDAGTESIYASERVDLSRPGCNAKGPDGKALVQTTPVGEKFHIPKGSLLSHQCFRE